MAAAAVLLAMSLLLNLWTALFVGKGMRFGAVFLLP